LKYSSPGKRALNSLKLLTPSIRSTSILERKAVERGMALTSVLFRSLRGKRRNGGVRKEGGRGRGGMEEGSGMQERGEMKGKGRNERRRRDKAWFKVHLCNYSNHLQCSE
jgi:hypothetical protein